MSGKKLTIEAELELLQRESFSYFVHETNPANGLVIDKTAPDWPASIAATGFALAAYPVGVERGFMSRAAAVERALATLRSDCLCAGGRWRDQQRSCARPVCRDRHRPAAERRTVLCTGSSGRSSREPFCRRMIPVSHVVIESRRPTGTRREVVRRRPGRGGRQGRQVHGAAIPIKLKISIAAPARRARSGAVC